MGEYHIFLSKNFCLGLPKNFVREPFFCVSENFWYHLNLWIRGRGGGKYHDFLSKLFCLTVLKNFRGEPCCASEQLSSQRKIWIRAGIPIFRRKTFRLTVPKNFVVGPFCVSEKFFYRIILGMRVGSERRSTEIFRRNFVISQYRKASWENPSVSHKMCVLEKLYG